MMESSSRNQERARLHLGLYAGLAAKRAQALEDAEEARKELERETDPEFSRALRGAIHGAEGIVEWIDEAIGGPRCLSRYWLAVCRVRGSRRCSERVRKGLPELRRLPVWRARSRVAV